MNKERRKKEKWILLILKNVDKFIWKKSNKMGCTK